MLTARQVQQANTAAVVAAAAGATDVGTIKAAMEVEIKRAVEVQLSPLIQQIKELEQQERRIVALSPATLTSSRPRWRQPPPRPVLLPFLQRLWRMHPSAPSRSSWGPWRQSCSESSSDWTPSGALEQSSGKTGNELRAWWLRVLPSGVQLKKKT